MGYAGGLISEKGVDLLLRACATLTGSWQLLLAGEGPEQPSLLQLARRLNLADRVAFVGRLPADEMVALLEWARRAGAAEPDTAQLERAIWACVDRGDGL